MSIELREGRGAHEWEVRVEPGSEPLWSAKARGEEGATGREAAGGMAEVREKQGETGLQQREGQMGQQEEGSGQVWADVGEMRVHGEGRSGRQSGREKRAGRRAPHLLRPRAMKD